MTPKDRVTARGAGFAELFTEFGAPGRVSRGAAAGEPEASSPGAFLRLFSASDIQTISGVIAAVSDHREEFLRRWHDLYVTRCGGETAFSDRLFRAVCVPDLRNAVLRLGEGDVDGFLAYAALLGEHLAEARVSFTVLVAQLHLLKESCLQMLGEDPVRLSAATLLAVDKLTASCITAAADGYYHGWLEPGAAAGAPAYRLPSLEPEFHGMIGNSAVMRRLYDKIRRIALGRAPAMIIGETGTGKELIARAIHACGPRRGGPFLAVNCAALPRDLVESELFGYKRGAFSGALGDHLGLFRAASGGTVLLDEITEMSPELQAKLLRVVQESSVRPVGSVEEVKVDVRFISSTNREPGAALDGALRSDLYYRLSVETVDVPPLRRRDDDLSLLVAHCLSGLNARHADAIPRGRGVSGEAMLRLRQHTWPGNVRELFNVLERAYHASTSSEIAVGELGLPDGDFVAPIGPQTYADSERALIERSLAAVGGNKAEAARQLGISRKKLYARLAKYSRP